MRARVARGDIPAGVPEGAHDIRTARDPDSRRHWGLFNFRRRRMRTRCARCCRPGEASLAGVECDIPAASSGGRILLRGSIDAEHAKAAGLAVVPVARAATCIVVVNWKQGRAYYWKV